MKVELPEPTLWVYPSADCEAGFMVYVEATTEAMQAFMRDVLQDDDPDVANLAACCYSASDAEGRHCGILMFAQDRLGVGYVAHEMAHAAFRAIEWHGLRVDHDAPQGGETLAARHASVEERYCEYVEHLNAEFWRQAYQLGLATPDGAPEGAGPAAGGVATVDGSGPADGGRPPDQDLHDEDVACRDYPVAQLCEEPAHERQQPAADGDSAAG